jgi:hypothetical protein
MSAPCITTPFNPKPGEKGERGMKVLCVVGSPRKDGNTNALIGHAAAVLNEKGNDQEGILNIKHFAGEMAWLLRKINAK